MENSNLKKTLVLCSRGVSHQQRHIVADIARLLPHSKKESKVDRKKNNAALNELAEMHSCDNIIYLEGRKKISFLWIMHYPSGPSVKFVMQNVHTSEELKMKGNCLKKSKFMLSFDNSFKSTPTLLLIQQVIMQTFASTQDFESSSFVDHVFSFSHANNKIYFRNFEVIDKSGNIHLEEIGPRFVLTPIKVIDGVGNGKILYKNGSFLSHSQEPLRKVYEKKKNANNTQKKSNIDLKT